MENTVKTLILVGCLAVQLLAASDAIPAEKEHSTVIEKNHFFSNYEVNTTYNITKVNKEKPIILFLKKKDENAIFTNNVTITLISGDKTSECYFTSFNKMCFMDKLPDDNMKLKIKCESLPCDVSWTILQPGLKKVQQKQQISNMFDISESNDHMIAMVTCNNPEIKDFNSRVQAFSENQYIRGSTNNIIYFLFTKEKQGHLYFKIDPQAKSCAHMGVYNVPQTATQGAQIKDFALKSKLNIFKFASRPTGQFRIDASIHEINKDPLSSQIQIKIFGDKAGSQQLIFTSSVGPGFGTTTYDFSFVVPKISSEYSNLRMGFQSNNKPLFINFAFKEGIAEIQRSQHSHYVAKSGDVLKYRLIVDDNAAQSEKAKIIMPTDQSKATLDKSQCSYKAGCQFTLTASQDVSSILYIGASGESGQQSIKQKQINFIDFTDKITHKIREDDSVYFRKKVKKDKVFQLVVNNPNIILYASSKEKCAVPSEECYEKIGNFHNPFIYAPQIDTELLLVAEGLDTCEFTLTAIAEGDAIILNDNEPFAYLMDNYESDLVFEFKNEDKNPVSFNLIAPMHDLMLIVRQGKDKPDPDEDPNNLEGYISYTKKQITDKQFRIMVKKNQNAKDKFVHFTLIASTSQTNLRLDPGVAHYETLKPKQYKDVVFEFDKEKDYLINFYVQNIDKTDLKIPILVSNEDKWTDKKVKHFSLDQTSDTLNLKDVSEELCQQEGEVTCEIFIRTANQMDTEIDLTLTLMVKDSVIELKDGLWQSYALNEIASSSHFYFIPKSANKSISIHYRTGLVDLGMVYSIWKSDQKNSNPSQWPFPDFKQEKNIKMDEFKSMNHIMIEHENLKQCWPSCVILVSLYKKKGSQKIMYNPQYPGQFSIMASNQILELPEKTKLDIYLKSQETKFIMIDLKYALDKEQVIIFRNSILGYEQISANVYSQKNQRCPEEWDGDFNFYNVETAIKTEAIRQKISENDMDDDNNLYLCLRATGITESKFNIEYTTDSEEIQTLGFDGFTNVMLQAHTPKFYQMEAWQDYEIKFTREKGYFYVKLAVCDGEKEGGYEQCRQKLLEDQDDKGKKVISKTEEFTEKPCQKCIVYIRLEAQEPSQLVVHVQSKYSTVQLKEKDAIADFTNEGEQNKYSITSVQTEETIINVEVTEGDPVVSVTDYGSLQIRKQKNATTNNIHIVIPPMRNPQSQQEKATTALGGRNYYGFSYSSTFRYLGIKVKSKNQKMPCSYTISYSSGERQTYLEDGLLTGYTLEPEVVSKFLYRPKALDSDKKGYITISMNKSSTLYNLDLKMYTLSDPNDQDSKVSVTPEKPPMRKKTPNPTMIFSLPIANLVSIELKSKEEAKVTIMINHEEVVVLPFNQEFPFQLKKNEKIGLLTDVNNLGYIVLNVRKCDESEPTFGYTFEYDEFQKSEFEYSIALQNDPRFQFYIKASKIGTLYMQLSNNELYDGLYTIQATFSDKKIKANKMRSGNNGAIEYSLINSKKALVKFNGVICPTGKCQNAPKYYWLAGNTLQDVYTQTVCPYSFFLTADVVTIPPLKFNMIETNGKNDEITFEYELLDHTSYLSIRAIAGTQEVYYRPIEVITLWGSINKSSKLHKIMMGSVFMLVFVCGLVGYRKIKKSRSSNSWGKLPEDNDEDGFDQI